MSTTFNTLSLAEHERARGYLYHLLGTVFLQGIHEGNLEHLQVIPELEEPLQRCWGQASLEPAWLDLVAADHQHLFGFNVFPYQSMFLSWKGQIGGDETARVVEHYTAAHFPVVVSAESPDHIGVQLFFLAFLAQEGAAPDVTAAFLDEHFLLWVPLWVQAVHETKHPVFSVLASLALEVAIEHRRELEPGVASPWGEWEKRLPAVDDSLLERESTGLREIADYLLTPARSGLYLTRDDIRSLSRKRRVPAGFGPRRLMLTNLFQSAVEYQELPDVVGVLREHVGVWQNKMTSLTRYELSVLEQVASLWTQRLRVTEVWLQRMEQEAFAKTIEMSA